MVAAAAFKSGAAEILFGARDLNKLALLVCGGRDYNDDKTLYIVLDTLNRDPGIQEIIQGGARGADMLAFQYARDRKIMCTTFHADWNRDGKAAGPIRNQRMLEEGCPDMVLAFPGGRGTADMITRARNVSILVYEVKGEFE